MAVNTLEKEYPGHTLKPHSAQNPDGGSAHRSRGRRCRDAPKFGVMGKQRARLTGFFDDVGMPTGNVPNSAPDRTCRCHGSEVWQLMTGLALPTLRDRFCTGHQFRRALRLKATPWLGGLPVQVSGLSDWCGHTTTNSSFRGNPSILPLKAHFWGDLSNYDFLVAVITLYFCCQRREACIKLDFVLALTVTATS